MLAIRTAAALALAGANARVNTPLHFAAQNLDPADIAALLDAGADPRARTNDGKFPFDLAKNNEKLKGIAVYWQLNEARFE